MFNGMKSNDMDAWLNFIMEASGTNEQLDIIKVKSPLIV